MLAARGAENRVPTAGRRGRAHRPRPAECGMTGWTPAPPEPAARSPSRGAGRRRRPAPASPEEPVAALGLVGEAGEGLHGAGPRPQGARPGRESSGRRGSRGRSASDAGGAESRQRDRQAGVAKRDFSASGQDRKLWLLRRRQAAGQVSGNPRFRSAVRALPTCPWAPFTAWVSSRGSQGPVSWSQAIPAPPGNPR